MRKHCFCSWATSQSSHQKAKTDATGGGCLGTMYLNTHIESCINYGWPNVNSDTYINWGSFPDSSPLQTCTVTLIIYGVLQGRAVQIHTYDCYYELRAKSFDDYYGAITYYWAPSGIYFPEAVIRVTYKDSKSFGTAVFGPPQTA